MQASHSDVDIILMGGRIQDCFDDIVGAFDKILLSECFTATSTYMIVYMNGLAVEYDIRRSVTKEDIKKSRILNIEDCRLSDICRDRVHIDSQLCPVRSSEYSKLMIAQMCYAKLLCQKDKLAREIYYDRIRLLSNTGVDNGLNLSEISMESQVQFINRLKHLVQTSTECSVEIEKYLDSLLLDIQRHIARENSNT